MSESAQRYRVIEKLESGGMAEVFRAESNGLQGFRKQVAIKRVLPHLSEKKTFISMFLDEARLSAQLSHSNCVQVFDIGAGDQTYFIVMEFVDGANLKSIAESVQHQGKDFPVAAAAFIAHEICKGLSYAHELTDHNGVPLQLVHRDISPPNVLLTKYGEVKIVDFGLAKASSQLEKSEPGIIKGKFSYLSPEAVIGEEVDGRTDIFAVGIILWELLASRRLFLGDSDFQTIQKIEAARVPPISQINRKVPLELERIVHKALAKGRDQRYRTARELGQALSDFLFRFAQPVSSYDLAMIVQGTMREKQHARATQGSIIDKLIEEALFEFTSLKEDGAPGSGVLRAAAAPLNADLFLDPRSWGPRDWGPRDWGPRDWGPRDWGNEDGIGQVPRGYELRASLPPEAFDPGNLSALEDTGPTPLFGRGPSPGGSPPPGRPTGLSGHLAPVASGRFSGQLASSGKSAGSGAAIAVVLFLVLALAASAAWFTGIIPHP
jgi:serine/threonine-protein kinase